MAQTTKNYPVFDCDAHISDHDMPYQKYYTAKERALVENWFWHYGDHALINGRSPLIGARPEGRLFVQPGATTPYGTEVASNTEYMGPGMNKGIIRAIRHLDLSTEELEDLAFPGTTQPLARVEDMDLMGIDQVLVIPITLLLSVQWVENAAAAAAVVRAYNNWVKQDYCDAAPERLYPAAVLAPQDPAMAAEELVRVARLGFPVGLVRPIDALGRYPNQPIFDPLWRAFEETGLVCGVHTVTGGQKQETQYSPGQLLDRSVRPGQMQGAGQSLSFVHEAMAWVAGVLLSGFLERYPALKMAVFESNATWLPMLLESCDRAYRLYGNQRLGTLEALPSETFHRRCLIAFESDEEPIYRRSGYYRDLGIWSSDTYHHDGADAWDAIERMNKHEVPEETQALLMGGNARRFYGLEDTARVYTTGAPSRSPLAPWFQEKLASMEPAG